MAEQDYIHMPTLEEYAERFKRFFKFKRSEDGILEVKMHTFEGPVRWSYQMHHAISELWTAVGHDTKNEVLIFTATGDQWINDVDASSFKDIEDNPDNIPRFNVQIYDTLKVVENFVNDIEIPTICAITGQGIHWEMAMMSDITLCTPDSTPVDTCPVTA
jgi:enoyl-CoA hydratase/carnithine racemase